MAASVALWLVSCRECSFLGGPAGSSGVRRGATVRRRAAAPAGAASGGYTLRYFDGRGVAETARFLFVLAGEPYEDKRYSFSFGTPGDFSTIKREEFEADKAKGLLDIALGKVPILHVGPDFSLPQSKAIERYLAGRFGFLGETPEEAAWVDAVGEHVRDVNDAYRAKGLFFMKDADKKAEIEEKWFGEELPAFLKKIEASLPGDEGFAVGNKVSLADVLIFKLLKDTYSGKDVSAAYADCPKLSAIVAGLEKHEGLQKWLAERPETMF